MPEESPASRRMPHPRLGSLPQPLTRPCSPWPPPSQRHHRRRPSSDPPLLPHAACLLWRPTMPGPASLSGSAGRCTAAACSSQACSRGTWTPGLTPWCSEPACSGPKSFHSARRSRQGRPPACWAPPPTWWPVEESLGRCRKQQQPIRLLGPPFTRQTTRPGCPPSPSCLSSGSRSRSGGTAACPKRSFPCQGWQRMPPLRPGAQHRLCWCRLPPPLLSPALTARPPPSKGVRGRPARGSALLRRARIPPRRRARRTTTINPSAPSAPSATATRSRRAGARPKRRPCKRRSRQDAPQIAPLPLCQGESQAGSSSGRWSQRSSTGCLPVPRSRSLRQLPPQRRGPRV